MSGVWSASVKWVEAFWEDTFCCGDRASSKPAPLPGRAPPPARRPPAAASPRGNGAEAGLAAIVSAKHRAHAKQAPRPTLGALGEPVLVEVAVDTGDMLQGYSARRRPERAVEEESVGEGSTTESLKHAMAHGFVEFRRRQQEEEARRREARRSQSHRLDRRMSRKDTLRRPVEEPGDAAADATSSVAESKPSAGVSASGATTIGPRVSVASTAEAIGPGSARRLSREPSAASMSSAGSMHGEDADLECEWHLKKAGLKEALDKSWQDLGRDLARDRRRQPTGAGKARLENASRSYKQIMEDRIRRVAGSEDVDCKFAATSDPAQVVIAGVLQYHRTCQEFGLYKEDLEGDDGLFDDTHPDGHHRKSPQELQMLIEQLEEMPAHDLPGHSGRY